MLLRSLIIVVAGTIAIHGQWFGTGSTGSDGALSLTTPGTVVFDPSSFKTSPNSRSSNIYNFTSIYIASGVTLKLSSEFLIGPVFWLAQGPVQIDGTIDLDGADGGRAPSLAGAGGFPGGAPRRSGYRPNGFRPNAFLVPLVGGAGGDGGELTGGGAGGGALLIASSASITLNGVVTANGGGSSDGKGGGGGAIRLVAPTIDGAGVLSARGGQSGGVDGQVRLEALTNMFTSSLNSTPISIGKPFGLFLPPDPAPSVRVLSLDGSSGKNSEFSLARPSEVAVIVEARHVPPGTVVELEFFPEDGPVQILTTPPLAGTVELSRAVATVTLPRGSSRAFAKAVWNPVRQP
jgi:hypothetical protein